MSTDRALLIGSQTGGLTGVHSDVEAVDDALRGLGFTTTRCIEHDATYDAIVAAYRGLIEDTVSGDAAVVYYSGHGGRQRNALAADDPTAPTWLQYLVPTDVEDRADGRFHDVPAAAGPNRVLAELGEVAPARGLPRYGRLGGDLGRLFAELGGQGSVVEVTRRREGADATADRGPRASAGVTRLWARDRVLELLREGRPGAREEAVRLASDYALVTPVTGAVVLETKEQFDRAGLRPVDPADAEARLAAAPPSSASCFTSSLSWISCVAFPMRKKPPKSSL